MHWRNATRGGGPCCRWQPGCCAGCSRTCGLAKGRRALDRQKRPGGICRSSQGLGCFCGLQAQAAGGGGSELWSATASFVNGIRGRAPPGRRSQPGQGERRSADPAMASTVSSPVTSTPTTPERRSRRRVDALPTICSNAARETTTGCCRICGTRGLPMVLPSRMAELQRRAARKAGASGSAIRRLRPPDGRMQWKAIGGRDHDEKAGGNHA
jgi:hypothetical protein